jgi:hypothetical protein
MRCLAAGAKFMNLVVVSTGHGSGAEIAKPGWSRALPPDRMKPQIAGGSTLAVDSGARRSGAPFSSNS